MGVGRIFSRGAPGDFSKIFPGGAKNGEICFFPLKTEKNTFCCWKFQIQGRQAPSPIAPLPTPPMLSFSQNKVLVWFKATLHLSTNYSGNDWYVISKFTANATTRVYLETSLVQRNT